MSRKSFYFMQILIVAMVIIGLLVNTYAWSERGGAIGNALKLTYTAPINGDTAEIVSTEINGTFSGNHKTITFDHAELVAYGDVYNCKAYISNNEIGALSCNVSLYVKIYNPKLSVGDGAEGDSVSQVNNVLIRVNHPTRETEEQLVKYDDLGYGWLRVVTSCEIAPGTQDMLFEWNIEFLDGGTFIINDIVLEYF